MRWQGLLLALAVWAGAVDLAPIPALTGHVVDQTGTLSERDRQAIDSWLADFETRKGSQITVLIVPTTEPEAIEQYSLRVVEAWKIGRKKVDDGLLFLVAKNDRKMRFEVGYGLEGALPDALTKRIQDEIVTPRFRAGDFTGGIAAALEATAKVIQGENLPPPPKQKAGGHGRRRGPPIQALLIGAIVAVFVCRAVFGRIFGGVVGGAVVGGLAWLALGSLILSGFIGVLALILVLLGFGNVAGGLGRGAFYGGMGGGFGGMGGGGFGGGGGFSGGGGSFGGGGSSGNW